MSYKYYVKTFHLYPFNIFAVFIILYLDEPTCLAAYIQTNKNLYTYICLAVSSLRQTLHHLFGGKKNINALTKY